MIELKIERLPDKCPDCGADWKKAGVDGIHSNGQQFEVVTYNCFRTLRWSPNFERIEELDLCVTKRPNCIGCGDKMYRMQDFCDDSCASKWAEARLAEIRASITGAQSR